MPGKPWTLNETLYVVNHYPHERTANIAKALGRSEKSIYMQAKLRGVKKSSEFLKSEASGRRNVLSEKSKSTRFKKGHKPFNKGKKRSEYMDKEVIEKVKKTQFKKGHEPKNTKYDGALSVRKSHDTHPYVYVRVSKARWRLLHRVLWEKHYGPIPKGHNIVFKNRDQFDIRIENLEMVSDKELMLKNSVQRYPEELRRLIQAKGALNRQINKILNNE
jgi:hypothetical protein